MLSGDLVRVGFFTLRYIDATDASAADEMAVRLVRETDALRDVRNDPCDPPSIRATESVEIDASNVPPVQPGLAFYKEEVLH